MPKLSIVIPTRRLDATLAGRIHASLARLPDIEILVIEPDDVTASPSQPDAAGQSRP